ncbi:MAG: polysaccharide deacetylase family protein, partial [Solirubrobacteraceae bacterium]
CRPGGASRGRTAGRLTASGFAPPGRSAGLRVKPNHKLVKRLITGATRRSGLPVIVRRTVGRRRVAILLYHDPSPETFAAHMQYVKRHHTFISLACVVDALTARQWHTVPDNGVVVTFDDGRRGNYALLSLFKRYDVHPTIYVCTSVVGTDRHFWQDGPNREDLKRLPHRERIALLATTGFTLTDAFPESRTALSREEVAEMGEWVDFQCHTRFHPILTTCDDEMAREEVTGSRLELRDLSGAVGEHFAFPNGDFADREIRLVRDAGFRSARTINVGWTSRRSDPYELRIMGVDDIASVDEVAADLCGFGFVRYLRYGNLRGVRPIVTAA